MRRMITAIIRLSGVLSGVWIRDRTEDIMDYIANILQAVQEGSTGINLAAANTADLSDQIANISSRILQNKQVADALSEEAEHFVS